jgi:hypothetical protein
VALRFSLLSGARCRNLHSDLTTISGQRGGFLLAAKAVAIEVPLQPYS